MGIMTSLLLKRNDIGCGFDFEKSSIFLLVLILISKMLKRRKLVSILVSNQASHACWF